MPSVCLAFFSPCDFKLPKKHLADTIDWLRSLDCEIVLAEALQQNQSAFPAPAGVRHLQYHVKSNIFRKENLWNLAAQNASSDELIFLDSDITIEPSSWLDETVKVLQTCDIMQPFTEAVWLTHDGEENCSKSPISDAIARGYPVTEGHLHQGFGWAMTRDAFNRMSGFYDKGVLGSGDTAFALALSQDSQITERTQWLNINSFMHCPSYKRYRAHALKEEFKIGSHPGAKAVHKWHGTNGSRYYYEREFAMPLEDDKEYFTYYDDTGCIEWGCKQSNSRANKYFKNRNEDGQAPYLIGIGTPKSGSNSLRTALAMLGYEVCHLGARHYHEMGGIGWQINRNYKRGVKLFEGIDHFDAMVDYPMQKYYQLIAEQYPDSRFILTYRDPHAVALSAIRMQRWFSLKEPEEYERWPDKMRTYSQVLEATEKHINGVFEFFRDDPARLLVLDCADDDVTLWSLLCDFTKRSRRAAEKPWPWSFNHQSWEVHDGLMKYAKNNKSHEKEENGQ